MWYEVPKDKPKPSAAPKVIFPWEERAVKATRVFPRSREPTPPPVEEEEEEQTVDYGDREETTIESVAQDAPTAHAGAVTSSESTTYTTSTARDISKPSAPPLPPPPPRHVFPWESRAPKATRVFPQENVPGPPPNTAQTLIDPPPPSASEVAAALNKSTPSPSAPDNPWDTFAQQTNKWDEDPEIARFMESFNRPRRAQVHVLHDTRSHSDDGQGPPPARERRTSVKLTDFPTEVERPSLPVTPAPIRRPSEVGPEDQDNQSVLPIARGVPRQDEWVRRFTSHCLPDFPDPVLRDINGVLHLTCQHCGRQNPIIKLEELQRRQSLILTGEERLEAIKTPPRRQMPESKTREEAIEAAMRAMNTKLPAKPHGILKEPSFEIPGAGDSGLTRDPVIITSHMTATGSKSPTRFNPIVLEGEAASESNSFSTSPKEESSTVTHYSTLPHSNASHSLRENTGLFNPAATLPVAEEVISPASVA